MTKATIEQYGNITTSRTSHALVSCQLPTSTQKAETDNLLAPKPSTSYVDAQLLLNANVADMTAALALKAKQGTTYTVSEVDGKMYLKAPVLLC